MKGWCCVWTFPLVYFVFAIGQECSDDPVVTSTMECQTSNPLSVYYSCTVMGTYLSWNGGSLFVQGNIAVSPMLEAGLNPPLTVPGLNAAETHVYNDTTNCFQSTLNFTGSNISALHNESLACMTTENAQITILIPSHIQTLHKIASQHLMQCGDSQGMITLKLHDIQSDSTREIVLETPIGFSCDENCDASAANVSTIGVCNTSGFLVTVKAINCTKLKKTEPDLQQTVPLGGGTVCPLSTIKFTCMTDSKLQWRELGTSMNVTYTTSSTVNDATMAGIFRTVLTGINGNTLTSTATTDNVTFDYNGKNVSCSDDTGSSDEQVLSIGVEDAPPAPSNVDIKVVNTAISTVTVNLTWSLDNRCVEEYHIEVNSTNNSTSYTTSQQNKAVTLQTGILYFFRVKGTDRTNRGEWSNPMNYSHQPALPIPMTTPLLPMATQSPMRTPSPIATPTTSPTIPSSEGLSGGAIAGIVMSILSVIVIGASIIAVSVCYMLKCLCFKKKTTENAEEVEL